ncbi:cyclin cyclin [Cryptosporidium sp. chipmunk genotype I]|uniref:cyclin cyclin n=1 Tax=Cryptosporidium sp. chipmunk genotype I TaxID=1280935 RepID=UPI00351A7F10|nr:cyclin cyclin [Cryptosporidium sp. chipmunk genotype I]
MKIYSKLKDENEKTSNSLSYFPKKNSIKIGKNFASNISKFEKTLYEENYLRIISEEMIGFQLLNDKNGLNMDNFNEFVISIKSPYIKNIESISYFDHRHNIGSNERFKIIYWLSLHSNRLKFQSCTFHLSCRIFDTFLFETPVQYSNSELAATAAACFLLASNIIETVSDMIVPSIKQFCNAAKWLNPDKILKRQLEILTHVKTNFGVNYTPNKLLYIYISRIKYHSILSKEFLHLYRNGKIIQIFDFSLAICDLLQYTPLPTTKNGQSLISILPCFILWVKLESNIIFNEFDYQYIQNLFFKEICSLSNYLCQKIVNTMYKIAKELVDLNERLVMECWKKQERQIIRSETPNIHLHIFPDKKN